jgi:hypothetical protein
LVLVSHSLKEISNEYLKGWAKEHAEDKTFVKENKDNKEKNKDKDVNNISSYRCQRSDQIDHPDNLSSGSENSPFERHD